jgi:ABC-type dipeptide/oligopeptide/nickel transport system permease component
MGLAIVTSFPLGIAAARRRGGPIDSVVSVGSLIGQSLPTFWVGIMLILVFSRFLKIMPSGGSSSLKHLVLPAVTLALPLLGALVRLIRSGLLDVMGEPYIQTARSKGLSERAVTYGHALKNMLLPVVTLAGLQAGELLSGVVIVEVVFAWPGLGRLLVDAIFYRDYPIVQAAMVLVAATYALVNLAVDLMYVYLDPRVRHAGAPV